MKKTFQKITWIPLLVFIVFFAQNKIVFAQGSLPINQISSIGINASPSNPKPGDNVLLELSGYSINLDSIKITWFVDGIAKKEGVGQKSFTVKAKESGESTAVKAVLEKTDGTTNETSIEITPAEVDLIIEPKSYVPPFYKGATLFANQGTVRIIAIPQIIIGGEKVDSKNLMFRWQKNGNILASNSGTGLNILTLESSIPARDLNIELDILNSSGKTIAETSKILSADDPKVLFYENNPLYGILFNEAIVENYYLGQKEELDIVAEPYFFDILNNSENGSTYNWSLNGNSVSSSGKPNELLLRQANTSLKGSASVSVDVNGLVKIFQFTSNNFNVNFGI
jgi:hypothetical protein